MFCLCYGLVLMLGISGHKLLRAFRSRRFWQGISLAWPVPCSSDLMWWIAKNCFASRGLSGRLGISLFSKGYLPRRPRWLKLVIDCGEIIA
jgi:hypothetical protein